MVPVVFELVFVGWLYTSLSDIEAQAEQAEEARVIATHMNRFLRLMMEVIGKQKFDVEHIAGPMDTAMRVREVEGELNTLERLVKDRPKERKIVKELKVALREVCAKAEQLNDYTHSGDIVKVYEMRKDIRPVLNNMAINVETIRRAEEALEESAPHVVSRRRVLIKNILIFGVSMNIALAIAMALIVYKGLVLRLSILYDNSIAFKENRPLRPSPGGDDEISALDRAFRDMVDSVLAARLMKQQFVAVVSHELRTPLTSVDNFLDMVKEGIYGKLSDSGLESLAGVQTGVDRLIKLTRDLLDVERLDAGQLQLDIRDASLDLAISQALQAVSGAAANADVSIEAQDTNLVVKADSERIVQVFINLLSNAIKFSPEKGIVAISISAENEMALIEIKDSGPGIAREHQDRIFDRFQQVNIDDAKKRGGSGLGLAICKLIVEQHGGRIGVKSEPGRGSVFWFTLPLADT
jgi:signal transduction histidine kinase